MQQVKTIRGIEPLVYELKTKSFIYIYIPEETILDVLYSYPPSTREFMTCQYKGYEIEVDAKDVV